MRRRSSMSARQCRDHGTRGVLLLECPLTVSQMRPQRLAKGPQLRQLRVDVFEAKLEEVPHIAASIASGTALIAHQLPHVFERKTECLRLMDKLHMADDIVAIVTQTTGRASRSRQDAQPLVVAQCVSRDPHLRGDFTDPISLTDIP
jgi:hypothetical protein